MPPEIGSPWSSRARFSLGNALLSSESGEMTASQLSESTGKDQSNQKKLAEELVAEGVLRHVPPSPVNGGPGRRARTAFAFASDSERERFEELIDKRDALGLLSVGQQIVFVDAGQKMEALSEVLSQVDSVRGSRWSTTLDGDRAQVMIVFEGPSAVDDSRDLMAIFSDAQLEARRSSVAQIGTPRDLVKSERRRKERLERNRRHRRTMQDGPKVEGK
jgi:hypothetical protein